MTMPPLSKSNILAYRQCPKRLWLEVHQPSLKTDSGSSQARFDEGREVSELARFLYDPDETGDSIDSHIEGWTAALARTKILLSMFNPIFEASFSGSNTLAVADVLLPLKSGRKKSWRMIEVKSSSSVKDHHLDDVAIQAYVVKSSGLPLHSVAVAHIDPTWVYGGDGDYRGLLTEVDLTREAFARHEEVATWIDEAQAIRRKRKVPAISTGAHCNKPFECSFLAHCRSEETQTEYPVQWLPRVQTKNLKECLASLPSQDMRDVPDELLNPIQLRVKQCSLNAESYFDLKGAIKFLKAQKAHYPPLYFLDFETIQFAIPRFTGTKPYQQIPFQFSCHFLGISGKLAHEEHLDLSGNDPSLTLAKALIKACGETGVILAYAADFEKSRIHELAKRFPKLKPSLTKLAGRIVDLLPVVQQHYYHPDMMGSWSIKKVLPTLVPSLSYKSLEGVQHGGNAVAAYAQAIDVFVSPKQKTKLEKQLRNYCALDTYAMVCIWQIFEGRTDLKF